LKENNLQVNGNKSSFCAIEAEFLGFVLTQQGVKPQVKKVKAIVKIATPKTVKQVCSFIGMINYYKDHIPRHSDLLTPLTALTKKGARFKWTDDCQHSFDELKCLLTKQMVLAYPNFAIPFEIYMDASNKQIGSVIQQNGRPLAFYSCKLTNAQTCYTVIELELLAIVETLQEYCTILLGHIIKIYTDHKNLTFANFNTDRVHRWQLIVEEYGPEIVYLPRVHNIVANFLSHHPISTNSINEIHCIDEIFPINNNNSFPLDFATISSHQQADIGLQQIKQSNNDYETCIIGCTLIVYLRDKIVVPQSLQRQIVDWYHTMLAHPSKTRTIKTIEQHFHWQTLSRDIKQFIQTCQTCQHYKQQRKNYGHSPTKIQCDIEPWNEVHVDLIGSWIIPQCPSKSPKLSAKPDMKQPLQVLALTMINPSTNLLELIIVSDKESRTVARAFDCSWLCRYPRPLICLHDKGTEFTGIEFQELLQSYGIKAVIATTANPQTNAILERTHQVIANQLRSLCLMSIKLTSLANIQHELLAPVQWAMNSTYHTTLQATSAQLAFHRHMRMPTSYMAHWQSICQRHQAITDHDNLRENARRVPHMYSVGNLVLIHQDTCGKLAKPNRGPYQLIDVARQHVNGTVLVDLNHSHETFNIWQLIPFEPRQNH
jgi:hypothetical protein